MAADRVEAPGPGGVPEAVKRVPASDPRIDAMYHSDVRIIYLFVVAMWVVLWSIFFAVVGYMDDTRLVAFLAALGVLACVFNTVGMVQNVRRLGHERSRFYSQDLYWQDRKRAQQAGRP